MDRDKEEAAARLVVLACYLVIGGISLIFFAIYWWGCRQRGIPGVVMGLPNSMQPNTVAVPMQNAAGAANVMVPGQNVMGPPCVVYEFRNNEHGAPHPVAASNPYAGAQYPVAPSVASGAGAVYPSVTNQEAPPSYNQTYQERAEQVPLFK